MGATENQDGTDGKKNKTFCVSFMSHGILEIRKFKKLWKRENYIILLRQANIKPYETWEE